LTPVSAPAGPKPAAAPRTIAVRIDGRSVRVPEGTTIWDAAARLGIDVPVLCHDPRLSPVGVCRTCVVDVKGQRVNPASCVRACEDGMEVRTATPDLERRRKVLVELLLADHPAPCERERTTGDCALEALGRRYGLGGRSRWHADAPPRPRDASSAVIAVDHASCILCDRCIRGCDDLQSNEVIGRNGKGFLARIGFDDDRPMGDSTCVSCGECAAVCPTGALTHRAITVPQAPASTLKGVKSVCPYCGVGCAITYFTDGRNIVRAEGRESPVNHGRLCVKGRYGFDYAHHPQRLTRPLVRTTYPKGALSREVRGTGGAEGDGNGRRRGGRTDYSEILPHFREASWEEALDLAASRLKALREAHGPAALAGFGSAKCSNEEAYLFQKLVRAAFGTNNVDHCTRLCHASSVAALLEGIGSGAVSNVFADVRFADVAMLIGTNTTENHPVAATFFKEAAKRGTKLICVDPRRPDAADFATHYVRFRPGTDVAFLNAMLHVIVEEGMVDEEFVRTRTTGFEGVKETVRRYTPEFAAGICGVPAEQIREVARCYGRARAAIMFWGMGISQHTTGTDNARCLIALCLATGNVGRPGTGLHPLRGQNNVQGASDAGLIPMVYPDYQSVEDPGIRGRFEEAWGVPLDPVRGLTVVEIVKGALEGRVKGMYMMGENPFMSDPNQNKVRKALSRLDFLVVQDIFLTETAEFADVILPAATALEKDGTYTNTDRRVQVGRKVIDPPGEAKPDWWITCEISGLPHGVRRALRGLRRAGVPRPLPRGPRLREPRRRGEALALPRPDDGRDQRAVRRPLPDRRREGAVRARGVEARGGAPRRGVPARAQHRPGPRALARRVHDAAVEGPGRPGAGRLRGDPPGGLRPPRPGGRGRGARDHAAGVDPDHGPGRRPHPAGERLHPLPLPRGPRELPHHRRPRPHREDPGVQVLRRAGGAGGGGGRGGGGAGGPGARVPPRPGARRGTRPGAGRGPRGLSRAPGGGLTS
jgi:formate dehydrogenase major subunit